MDKKELSIYEGREDNVGRFLTPPSFVTFTMPDGKAVSIEEYAELMRKGKIRKTE